MKTLILLLVIVSCGKNVNHSQRDWLHLSQLQNELSTNKVPKALNFKGFNHQITFKSETAPSHDFFEATDDIIRYYSFELSHIEPEHLYQLEMNIPEYMDLYLHDSGKDILLDPKNFKIDYNILDRLNSKKSYLALQIKKEQVNNSPLIVRNFHVNEIDDSSSSIEAYLKKSKIEPVILTPEKLISQTGDNSPRWWLKKDSPNKYKIIYSSLNDLKDHFQEHYEYKKQVLKRVNGKGEDVVIRNATFIKLTAQRTIQKQHLHTFQKTYYTQIGELPYQCHFKEAKAQQTSKSALSSVELRSVIRTNKFVGNWDYSMGQPLALRLDDLTSGFFDVGIVARKCSSAMGPKLQTNKVNQEKELELLIESYVRRG